MSENKIINWLLDGDVSIQYQVNRDLLGSDLPELQSRIKSEGWGARFLENQNPEGHWGQRFYQPKWISTNYSVLDLKNLQIEKSNPQIQKSLYQVVEKHKGPDVGILPIGNNQLTDLCINGMFLNYASYFGIKEDDLKSIVDCILDQHMSDGGYNCRSNYEQTVHSSVHTTISVIEGILEYENSGYSYQLNELMKTAKESQEFFLQHKLFKSDRTGEIIDKRFSMLSYPSRWRYDILRALDYFQFAGIEYDLRMQDALDILSKKRRKDGTWPVQTRHPGQTHFEMEKTGGPSRWNTLRVLRVLKHFNKNQYWEFIA